MNKIIMQNKNRIEASLLSNEEIIKNTEYTLPSRSGTLPIIVPELKDEECIEVTVGPNGNFKELHDALQEMSKFTISHSEPINTGNNVSFRKAIKILPNYIMEKPVFCLGDNYSDICIDATENTVNVNREAMLRYKYSIYKPYYAAIAIYNTISPLFKGKYTMMETGDMNVANMSLFKVSAGILTFDRYSEITGGFFGLFIITGSVVNAHNCKFIANNTTQQLLRQHGSLVDANRSTFDASNVNGEELYKTGIDGKKDFTLVAGSEAGTVNLYSASLIGNNYTGGLYLARAGYGTVMNLNSATLTNNSNGVSVSYGGIMSVNNVRFNNITTETNIPVNTVSSNGIIFK